VNKTNKNIKVCLISTEIFAWGKYGGFGRATRLIGRELIKKGIETTAIVPRREGQEKEEILDGIRVLGFDIWNIPEMLRIFKSCDADIFHSQEPSMSTFLAQLYHPGKKHIVTFRDTRLFLDWLVEFRLPSLSKIQVLSNWLYEDNLLVQFAVRKTDRCVAAANLLKDRARKKYHLSSNPEFLPTPVILPDQIKKDPAPTVCYIGRWDRRKRLELMLDLVRSYPDVNFLIAGGSRDQEYDTILRSEFSKYPNVELPGFINQFESNQLSTILSRSWVQVNTAAREGLPNSFIEGCAHKCALLSSVDPDGFTSKFGKFVSTDRFVAGLAYLLKNDRWKELGEMGYGYVKENFSLDVAIEKHIELYENVLMEHDSFFAGK